MAAKKFARGDKRVNGVKIVRANRLTAKSSPELKTKVIGMVAKANGFKPVQAQSMVNWILRNPDVVRTIKTSAPKAKAKAKKAPATQEAQAA